MPRRKPIWTYVQSSNLKALQYNPDTQNLDVQFHNHTIYRYSKVPEDVVANLIGSESMGRFFYYNIRDQYPFKQWKEERP